MKRLRVSLVAMPWAERDRPSSALGALTAYIRRERPDDVVTAYYEYLHVAELLGLGVYNELSRSLRFDSCEAMYASIFYPERREAVLEDAARTGRFADLELDMPASERGRFVMTHTIPKLEGHLEQAAQRIAKNSDLVGFTTSFGQLYANLALARRIKELSPHVKVVLGGSTVSSRVGVSVIKEYDFVDYIVQGEGEIPLTAVLDVVRTGTEAAPDLAGIISRSSAVVPPTGVPLSELARLDDAPIPTFDEYASLAEEYGIPWWLPIEASRGCWWDRTKRTGSAKNTCYFCNLNIQWGGYRQKSTERVADELEYQVQRYKRQSVYFVDNIIRAKGADEFAHAIGDKHLDLQFFYELRANLSSYEFLELVEAGMSSVQFGIEALSSSYLKRIGKGTTAIENLRAMRLCAELRVFHGANLIVDFPGGTPVEVEETLDAITRFAYVFQPLGIAKFGLGVGNTVDTLPEEFGVTNIRNSDGLAPAIPPEVFGRMNFFDLDFDYVPIASWQPVIDKVKWWRSLYDSYGGRAAELHYNPILTYRDAGNFLFVEENGPAARREVVFEGVQREVYLYCMEIRSFDAISKKFVDDRLSTEILREMLDVFVEDRLMFRENEKFLSVAVAATKSVAAKRIRDAHAEHLEESAKPKKRALRLPVLEAPGNSPNGGQH